MKNIVKKVGPPIIIISLIILFFSAFIIVLLNEEDRPDFLRGKSQLLTEKYNQRKDYYTAAGNFFKTTNSVKSKLYFDSVGIMQRELDSINIFVFRKQNP